MHVVCPITIMPLLMDVTATDPMTTPIHILRPILFRLAQSSNFAGLHSRLVQDLQNLAAEDVTELSIPHLLLDPSISPHVSFRESIVRQLFHSNALLRLHLKLAITDFCWVGLFLSSPLCFYSALLNLRVLPNPTAAQRSASNSENKNEYGAVAQGLLRAISHRVLGTLVRHMNLVARLLTRKLPDSLPFYRLSLLYYAGDDLPFVLRVVIQCMLPGTPQELSAEAETLANKVTSSFPPVEHEGVSDGLQELCPACGVEVPLTDIAEAICSNGHRWCKFIMISDTPSRYADGSPNPCWAASPSRRLPSSARCSVTSFILSTTMVQTCVGCARKAFLPATRSLYQQDRGEEQIRGEGVFERALNDNARTVGESGIENPGMAGKGWVVQELLKAVRRCLFCGNNFTILI